jgi:soluble lytic murein transglycosylase
MPISPTPLLLLLLSLFCAGNAAAQIAPLKPADAAMRAALDAAERGQAVDAAPFARDPLAGWLEYATLRRNIDTLPNAQGQAFLSRYQGQAVAEAFREIWLAALSRRQDWPAFRAAWKPGIKGAALQCAELDARQATGAADAQWVRDAQALWRSTGKALPDACASPFSILAAKGGLPPDLRWERIDKAAAEWLPAVIRDAARGLPADQFALANDYAAFFDAVNDRALQWPKTPRSRLMASQGLARLAKSTPVAAEMALPRFAAALGFTDADRARVLYQAALWSVASYDADSARRLNAVPDGAYDERLHEWRVREALSRSDWRAARAAVDKMGDKQRGDSRWSYFAGRLHEMTGDAAGAQAFYRAAATKSDFHGFLAADRLGVPYTLCPLLVDDGADAKAAVAREPALVRALALNRIGRSAWAQREWDDALSRFDDDERRMAIETAQADGWFDRGVFGLKLAEKPDEARLYTIRFPLHHGDTIRREATRNALDPAWVAAEIRAESIFNPNARSPANAMGLMQVLPSTGAGVAKRLNLPYAGAASLYDSETNIAIGSAYLRQMLDKYGQPYFAIAAYNAGPAPTARWQTQRPSMDSDFWIETISYKETRDYVARVLAFSVLYDWRMNGDALPVSQRLRGQPGVRKKFVCPLATTAG